MSEHNAVVGLYDAHTDAEAAVKELHAGRYASVLPQEQWVQRTTTTMTGNAPHGAVGKRMHKLRRDVSRRGRR